MMKNYADDIIKILNKSYYLYNTSVVGVQSCIDVVKCLLFISVLYLSLQKQEKVVKSTKILITHYH